MLLSLLNDGETNKKRWELTINLEWWSKAGPWLLLFKPWALSGQNHMQSQALWLWLQLWMLSTLTGQTPAAPISCPTNLGTISGCLGKLEAPGPELHKASVAGRGQEEPTVLWRIKAYIQVLALDYTWKHPLVPCFAFSGKRRLCRSFTFAAWPRIIL